MLSCCSLEGEDATLKPFYELLELHSVIRPAEQEEAITVEEQLRNEESSLLAMLLSSAEGLHTSCSQVCLLCASGVLA